MHVFDENSKIPPINTRAIVFPNVPGFCVLLAIPEPQLYLGWSLQTKLCL